MSKTTVKLTIDQQVVESEPGVSLLAALEKLELAVGLSPSGTPRGAFCAMGTCQECRVHVDGQPGVLACMTLVRDGMRVERRR